MAEHSQLAEGEKFYQNPQINYVDPSVQDYREYFDHLRAYNERVKGTLYSDFTSLLGKDLNRIALSTTGSDARSEKGPASLIEIMLLSIGKGLPVSEVSEKIRVYAANHKGLGIFDYVEVKPIDEGRISDCILAKGTPEEVTLISPNRIFDASFLIGDEEIFALAKNALVNEVRSEVGKSLYGRIKEKVRSHRKVTVSGVQSYKGQEIKHFDLDAGMATYDPEAGLYSFKQGPLRAVQYSLVRDQMKAIRNGSSASISLPSNTVDKLNMLEVQNNTSLTHDQVRDLADSYKYFLWLYHRSQAAYATKGLKEIGFDSSQVRDRVKSLAELCALPIVKDNI